MMIVVVVVVAGVMVCVATATIPTTDATTPNTISIPISVRIVFRDLTLTSLEMQPTFHDTYYFLLST